MELDEIPQSHCPLRELRVRPSYHLASLSYTTQCEPERKRAYSSIDSGMDNSFGLSFTRLTTDAAHWVARRDGQEARWTPHAEGDMSATARVCLVGPRSPLLLLLPGGKGENGQQISDWPVLPDAIALLMSLLSLPFRPLASFRFVFYRGRFVLLWLGRSTASSQRETRYFLAMRCRGGRERREEVSADSRSPANWMDGWMDIPPSCRPDVPRSRDSQG